MELIPTGFENQSKNLITDLTGFESGSKIRLGTQSYSALSSDMAP